MKCENCGSKYVKKYGKLEEMDDSIGPYSVDNVAYFQCSGCDEYLYPLKTVKALEKKRNEVLQKIIRKYPIESFWIAKETANYLSISRQALHKHRRIRRGFIYQTKFGDKMVYLKESVIRFKKTGDGRFCLVKRKEVSSTELDYSPQRH